MEFKILKESENKIEIEIKDETHTFLNLLKEKTWHAGANQASYMVEHPYLSHPKITVIAKNPRKVLNDAAQMIVNEAKEFYEEFKRAAKVK